MADLANLTMGFDPTPMKQARQSLDEVTTAAKKTENATADLGSAVERAGTRSAGMTKANERVLQSMMRMERAFSEQQKMLAAMGASMSSVAGSSTAAVRSLDALANAVQRLGMAGGGRGGGGRSPLGPLNDNLPDVEKKARLTAQQMQGLGYQINDIGTMLAMGSSPFQIMASQAGQVVQVLQEGGGLKSSLAAIGGGIANFARSIPVAGYAVAGLTAGVAALWYMTKGPEAREAEARLKGFEGAIKRLETGWKAAANAARDYAKAPSKLALDPNATFLDVRGSAKRLQTDLKAAVEELNTSDLLSGRILRPFAGHVSDARREISTLYADLRNGEISAQQFADEMLHIRLDPNAEVHARNFAEEIRLALPDVMALERQVQALNQATAKMAAPKGTMARNALPDEVFTDRFGPTMGGDNRFGSTEAMNGIREGLKGQREELEKTDKALRSYSDAVAEQKTGLAASVAQLQLQVDMFGQSEGAIAAEKFSMDALADARREAAASNNGVLDPTIEAEIGKQAEQYGRLTDQLNAAAKAQQERLRVEQEAQAQRKRVKDFGADLEFQKSILFLPQAEQQVRTTLRGLNVDFSSFEGQRLAESMRYIDSVRLQQSALQETSSIVEDMGDIFADVFSQATRDGESFFESVLPTFSGMGDMPQLFPERSAA